MNSERHLQHLRETALRFGQFTRNGRWGTCCGCPKDSSGVVYPEFCRFTERADHQLSLEDLVFNYYARTGLPRP